MLLDDPELVAGHHFGINAYKDKTPLDFITDPVSGVRPAAFSGTKPTGVSLTDLSQGVKDYHVLPPYAIWNRGKWWEDLSVDTRRSIHVDEVDEHEAWVCSGEGTPGNHILRVYIVPITVAKNQEPRHPSNWTKKQREEGDGKHVTTGYRGFGGGLGYGSGVAYTPPKVSTPSPPQPPPLPSGITFRCIGCGHWFKDEKKLAGHATHCCPGSSNWGEHGADWVLACECCLTFDETAACKPGYPRYPEKTKAEEPAPEPKPDAPEGEPEPEKEKELVTA